MQSLEILHAKKVMTIFRNKENASFENAGTILKYILK
jgi:hypothetical protein